MHRILPRKVLFIAFAWIVVGLVAISGAIPEWTHLQVKTASVPALAWLTLNLLLLNPAWRFFWKRISWLSRWFPDLNGVWEVEMRSNWSRHEQLLNAAAGAGEPLDMRTCPEDALASLRAIRLRAEISQTWWSIEMRMWNPARDTPIRESQTVHVEPFSRQGLKPAGISYFYKQQNETANVADDTEFFGAARLLYDADTDRLDGLAWTARMWPRAMNTAGPITFRRYHKPAVS